MSFFKNSVLERFMLRQFHQNPPLDSRSPQISDQVPHPPPFPRWCLITLACLHQESWKVCLTRTSLLLFFLLIIFSSTEPQICSLTKNSHLPISCLELSPISFPHCKIPWQWSLQPIKIALNKVCFTICNKCHWVLFFFNSLCDLLI